MNHKAYIRCWIRGKDIPRHEEVVLSKEFLLNRRLWNGIGIIALAFIRLVVWAAETGRIAIPEETCSPYPNLLSDL